MDFAALPPEVNSGRMYAGAGAGPMMAAATAWDGLASELSSAASAYQSLISELTGGPWLGPASASMAAAAAPYVAWMNTTATQAEQTANQARAATAAYEAAFAATVPPPVIAANRTLLTSLIATNIIGQNMPAIAATDAHYAEMWAQDSAAMYAYAGASAAATALTPFSEPEQNTNPAGAANQSAAASQATSNGGVSQAASQVPSALQTMAGAQSTDPVTSIVDWLYSDLGVAINNFTSSVALPMTNLTGPMFAASGVLYQIAPLFTAGLAEWTGAVQAIPEAAMGAGLMGSSGPVAGLGGMSAGLGQSASVGGLSVPQSWASAAPEIRLASMATALPGAGSVGAPALGAGAPGMFGGIPPVASVANAPRNDDARSRYKLRPKVVAHMPGESGIEGDMVNRLAQPVPRARIGEDPLSDRERDELARLREELVDLAMERDAAARLIREAIH
jgi:PPE-repeat protein